MRILALKITNIGAGTEAKSGPDEKKVSQVEGAITFDVPFAETPVIIAPGATVSAASVSGFTVSAACDVLVIGSDTSEKY